MNYPGDEIEKLRNTMLSLDRVNLVVNGDAELVVCCDYRETGNQTRYYSKCSKASKGKLILNNLDYENYASSLEVAGQLGLGSISSELLKHYKDLLKK